MTFSDHIKSLRKKTLLTQTEFAQKLGVSFTTVNRWENGKAFPNLSTMKKIKDFCDEHGYPYAQIEAEWIN